MISGAGTLQTILLINEPIGKGHLWSTASWAGEEDGGGEGVAPSLKSRDPHLAGGAQKQWTAVSTWPMLGTANQVVGVW